MSTESPQQIKANSVRLMGGQAGEAFADAGCRTAASEVERVLQLYAASPSQIDTLNKAAPGFFYLVSEAWWDGLILHIFRMTDGNKQVLSLVTLKKLLPAAAPNRLRPEA
jgi:hypothetical protein